jgi:Mrp family chromosome partitioning ATPase
MLCGAAMGLAVATVLGRFSRFVVDDVHASEILQIPLVARVNLPAAREYSGETPPPWSEEDRDTVNVVTAQLQTMAALDAPLRVAVVAGQRGAGATAMALALAGSLRRTGDRVVVMDADDRKPELTEICLQRGRPSTDARSESSELITSPPSLGSGNGDGTSDVLIVGRSGVLRREAVPALLAQAVAAADVVVADGGPLVDSAPAGELCHAADAVVFVVRRRGQRIDVLRTASMRLSEIRHKVLLVCVTLQEPSRRKGRRAARGEESQKEIPVLLPPGTAGA